MSDSGLGSADVGDERLTEKDTSYSPASEQETRAKQRDTADDASLPPGTGGPDDSGDDVLATQSDIDRPNDSGTAH
jgi:hypothetical protein